MILMKNILVQSIGLLAIMIFIGVALLAGR
jgi:hypothetical protein